MALSTYAELQSAIAYRCGNRSDTAFLASIVDAIALTEAEMQRSLQTTQMETTTTLTLVSGASSVALPTGYMRLRRVRLLMSGVYSDIYVYPLGVKQQWGSSPPLQLAVQGNSLVSTAPADQDYTLVVDYWAEFTPLSASNTSNWILANYPDAYLYGGMANAYAGVGSLDRAAAFASLFKEIISDINLESFERENADVHARTDLGWANRRPFNIRTG